MPFSQYLDRVIRLCDSDFAKIMDGEKFADDDKNIEIEKTKYYNYIKG